MRISRAKQKRAQQRRDEWNATMREQISYPITSDYFEGVGKRARFTMALFDSLSPELREIQRNQR